MWGLVLLLFLQDEARPPWEALKLAEIPADLFFLRAHFSPGGKRVLYEAKRGENFLYVVGHTPGEEFDFVEDLVMTPDGSGFAYRGARGRQRYLVTAAGKGEPLEGLGRPRFSPDGKRLACAVHEGHDSFMVVDGRRGPPYHRVSMPAFSPDGSTVAYTADRTGPRGRPECVVVRGEEITVTPYSVIWDPVFRPDGKTLAYPAKRGEDCFLVVGGKEAPEKFSGVYNPVFSRDGKHVAYSAFKDGNHMLALDHTPVPGTFGQNFNEFGFAPDHRLWYHHRRYNHPNVTVGDKDLQPPGESAGIPVFTPDGRHMAWIGHHDGKESVYLDGKAVFEGERFMHVALSPDGRHAACVDTTGGQLMEVKEKVNRGSKWRMVLVGARAWVRVGTKKSVEYDEVGEPVFSADSQWIGFGARKDRELWWQVMKVE